MATVRITEADLRQAMRDRRYWQAGHPERHAYVNWVTEGWQALGDAEKSGGTREVHVRAYSRVRDGRTEHVDAYVQTRQSAQADTAVAVRAGPGAGQPAPRPGITAASPTLVIFVGGGWDAKSRLVQRFQADAQQNGLLGHRTSEYFAHDERDRIEARIAAEPAETRIVLVGHSWGGDTAAQVAAALGQQGRPVDTLITVDPVGRGLSDDFFNRVRAGSREWINIRAYGAARSDLSDSIARAGNPYGAAPRSYATQYIEAPLNHGAFEGLLGFRGTSGASGFDRLLGR